MFILCGILSRRVPLLCCFVKEILQYLTYYLQCCTTSITSFLLQNRVIRGLSGSSANQASSYVRKLRTGKPISPADPVVSGTTLDSDKGRELTAYILEHTYIMYFNLCVNDLHERRFVHLNYARKV